MPCRRVRSLGRPHYAALSVCLVLGCVFHARPQPTQSPRFAPPRVAGLLSASRIVVEIDWLPGAAPSPRTVDGIADFLMRYARPARGVEVVLDEEIGFLPDGTPTGELHAAGDAAAWLLRDRHRRRDVPTDSQAIYLLFVPRRFDPGEQRWTRGVAFPGHSFAVISHETIRERAFLAIRADEIERFVVQHELGHLLGLVVGIHHESHGHCTNPTCLMYARPDLRAAWAQWWRAFTGGLPARLDADCEADLEMLRSRGARG